MEGIPKLPQLVVAGVVAGLVFWSLARWWPSIPPQRRSTRQWGTDIAWWLFTPTLGRALTRVALIGVGIGLAACVGDTNEPFFGVFAARSPVSRQPLWIQAVEVVILLDLIGYWVHRAKHEAPSWWRLHQVHHSPRVLDWLSATRLHPLDELTGALCRAVPLFVVGFSPEAFAVAIPGLGAYGLFLHANVRFTLGPLRYLIATPAFHRWHHSREVLAKNYGGLLVVWDRLFGTYYLPAEDPPRTFGVDDADVPETFFGQLVHPLKRRSCKSPAGSL